MRIYFSSEGVSDMEITVRSKEDVILCHRTLRSIGTCFGSAMGEYSKDVNFFDHDAKPITQYSVFIGNTSVPYVLLEPFHAEPPNAMRLGRGADWTTYSFFLVSVSASIIVWFISFCIVVFGTSRGKRRFTLLTSGRQKRFR